MSNRRTKKQKVQTSNRRQQAVYTLPTPTDDSNNSPTLSAVKSKPLASHPNQNLYAYDVSLLKRDMIRTGLNSLVICGILVGLYFWL